MKVFNLALVVISRSAEHVFYLIISLNIIESDLAHILIRVYGYQSAAMAVNMIRFFIKEF